VAPVEGGPPPAASPSIRKLARQLGIDLGRVRGSARGGRIVQEDLRAYIHWLQQAASERPAAPTAARPTTAPAEDFARWGPITRVPMSPLRQTVARRMSGSWTTIPHVTQFDEADITTLLELKRRYDAAFEQQGARLTLTAVILKAVVATLKAHPTFNASLDAAAQEIILKGYYHLGVAVDTEAGLMVPVIRDVDRASLLELSRRLAELAETTRTRKVTAEELAGGTFTVSNQGGIGGSHFTPIIKSPEVAILGVGRGVRKPVMVRDAMEPRWLLPLALSYDHRVVDGADAARFMRDLVKALEQFPEADLRPEPAGS
jgi:pyruvate dehydrogenase E2 component (dihydrolipoamide acetyltransferase)